MNKEFKLHYWDYKVFNWFILITSFCNIITLVTLMGNPLIELSGTTESILAFVCILCSLIMVYFRLRTVGLLSFGEKKK